MLLSLSIYFLKTHPEAPRELLYNLTHQLSILASPPASFKRHPTQTPPPFPCCTIQVFHTLRQTRDRLSPNTAAFSHRSAAAYFPAPKSTRQHAALPPNYPTHNSVALRERGRSSGDMARHGAIWRDMVPACAHNPTAPRGRDAGLRPPSGSDPHIVPKGGSGVGGDAGVPGDPSR